MGFGSASRHGRLAETDMLSARPNAEPRRQISKRARLLRRTRVDACLPPDAPVAPEIPACQYFYYLL